MEEQTIKTISAPRVNLKRNFKGEIGWEIVSSSSKDKEELEKIIGMLKEINQGMEKEIK